MWIYLFYILFFIVVILMTKDAISSIYFIKPMRKKYDIMIPDIPRNIKSKYIFIFTEIILILFFFKETYEESIVLFASLITAYIIIYICYVSKYKKYDLLEYIDWYSSDLFDWDKIYTLNIDVELRKQCFKIHNIDYDSYKEIYLRNLELKQYLLELETNRIKREMKINEK